MRRITPVAVAFLAHALLAAPAQAASFDCAQAGTAVEHMICGDAELSALDELLGDRYARALKKGDDPKAVKAAQRAWLRDTRNACADAACLKVAYEARVAELTKIGWMTDEKAKAICEEVVAAVNDGTLNSRNLIFNVPMSEKEKETWPKAWPEYHVYMPSNVLRIDYDKDGKTEALAAILTLGSCPTMLLADIEVGFDGPALGNEPGTYDVYRVLEVHGEYVVVRSGRSVFWFDPSGRPRPICTIDRPSDAKPRMEIIGTNPEPCERILQGGVEFLRASAEVPVTWASLKLQFADDFELQNSGFGPDDTTLNAILVDLDGDGREEALAEIGWASGAGCGSGDAWAVEIDRETGAIDSSSPLAGMRLAQIFGLGGITYIYREPAVHRYQDRKLVEQCRIKTTVTTTKEVVEFFPVESWKD